ncbi:MAG: nucleotide exchange factor GrpE [Candidatus Uhrbacteria bacterium]|nr:nucleotide exchange factor GrpE [Candidatus Uhrbacteria bacterium]
MQNQEEEVGGGQERSGEVSETELQQKCDEYLAGWKRALADYENLQKSNATLREEDRRRIRTQLAHDLLPVIDNFESAMKFAPQEIPAEMKNWFAGVSHIARQFTEVLASLGITPIEAVGHVFDPNQHDSGGAGHDDEKPKHVVLEELIRGYKIGDVVLRPAKVIVNE